MQETNKASESPRGPTGDPPRHVDRPDVREFAVEAARTLADDRCENVLVIDVRGLSQICDYLVIASGTSDRQMRSAADDLKHLGEERGITVFRRDADDRTTWVVMDFVHVCAHIFEPNTRAHYDLEMLWGDAPRIAWQRSGGARRDADERGT